MGLSENRVPLNPLVNHHFPYNKCHLGDYFQTDPYIIIYSMIFAARKHQVSPFSITIFFWHWFYDTKNGVSSKVTSALRDGCPACWRGAVATFWRSWVWGLFFDAENEDDDCWLMIIVDVTIMIVGSSIIVDMIYDYNDVEAADVVFFSRPEMGVRLMTVLVKKSLW